MEGNPQNHRVNGELFDFDGAKARVRELSKSGHYWKWESYDGPRTGWNSVGSGNWAAPEPPASDPASDPASELETTPRATKTCSVCGETGHNKRRHGTN